MRIHCLLVSLAVAIPSLAHASSPGQPLSVEDWVISLPGVTAEDVAFRSDPDCTASNFAKKCGFKTGSTLGADGATYFYEEHSGTYLCPPFTNYCNRHEIRRVRTDGVVEPVASIEERGYGSSIDSIPIVSLNGVDVMNGYLYIAMTTSWSGSGTPPYGTGTEIFRLRGLTTTFEIQQTYTPSAALSFSVPLRPEGLAGADFFDTYWGTLAHPIDFSGAQPLQCHYPSAPPRTGDALLVPDTLPDPEVGHGYYYVTAVHYQGVTRFGRQQQGGVTSGRDPSVLPACSL